MRLLRPGERPCLKIRDVQALPVPTVRVFRVPLTHDELRAVEPLLAAHTLRFAAEWRAVFAHWVGATRTAQGAELVTVTGWEDSDRVARAAESAGGREARSGLMGELVARGTVEDFELVDQLASSFEPAAAAVLRLVRLPARPGCEQELREVVESPREAWSGSGDLAVTQVLRRDEPDGPTLLIVAAWRDAASLMRLRGGPGAAVAPANLLRSPATSDTFDLLPVSALRLAPTGPAVLVSDDQGRVVDVTPAAAALLGRDMWDIVATTIDVVLPGREGLLRAPRPEGGAVLVQAVAAANTPAPGRHATVLARATEPPLTDADVRRAIEAAYRRMGDGGGGASATRETADVEAALPERMLERTPAADPTAAQSASQA